MTNPVYRTRVLLVASTLLLAACDGDDLGSFNQSGGAFGGGVGGGSGGGGASGGNEPTVVFAPDQVNGIGRVLLAGDGSRIAFTDDSDVIGTNPDEDWQVWSLVPGTSAPTQLTTGAASAFAASSQIDATDNGDEVVFVTSDDLLGTNNDRGNVFLASADGTRLTQVTDYNLPTDNGIREAIISGDGSIIAFTTDSDLTGSNPALDTHVFTVDSTGGNLVQVTALRAVPTSITFSDDGSKIAFHGVGDPLGLNPSSAEIFVMDVDGGNLMQLTSSDSDSLAPKLSDDGSQVVFTSNGDLDSGSNTDGSFEVFVAQTDGTGILQISDSDLDSGGGGFAIDNAHYAISGDGAYVVFTSSADFTGDNPDGDQTIFWATSSGGAVTQLLRPGTVPDSVTRRVADTPSLSDDGSTVSFTSWVNYTSATQPGNEKIYTVSRQ